MCVCVCMYVCFHLVTFIREHMWQKAFFIGYSIMRLELTLVYYNDEKNSNI